ncbi:type II toxin-antitoxin system VapC family toxin [Jiella mangrovi]|uniref:Type II toxin-antitoxin system VapC family toxin n=1 Tax=Jiella mangrovi TaxID=2821407 RepID=A0ABS4BGJ5_9HYPH|nr:type II toxin-antitoxin system VapC family toxin [Jiella mangrovi]MBP0615869.1 type II toxin-antitoxin system VapC family toxin [Jiella mangrovi]
MRLAGERLYLDSNTIIGLIERSKPLERAQKELMTAIGSRSTFAVTSEIAVAECIVRPLRDGDENLVHAYLRFIDGKLSQAPVQIDRQTILAAARLRADTSMKLPDALHVACAEVAGCTVFVSADQRLHVPAPMRRVSFDDIGFAP